MKFLRKTTRKEKKKGFTLVELSLSIAFISVLSLAVALIITNSISAYHRGLVLNQINTTGMELVDDIRAAVQNAPVVSLRNLCESVYNCRNNNGQDLVAAKRTANVNIGSSRAQNMPISGVFCTGNYSYIWNSGYFYNEDNSARLTNNNTHKLTLTYRNINGGTTRYTDDIRLLKVKDERRAVCAAFSANANNPTINIAERDEYGVVTEDPIELLSDNANLALYDLYAPAPAVNAGINNMYYAVSFVLGTLQGGANVVAQGNYCVTPEGTENSAIENFDYCAINKFNFAAQAVGGRK